MGNSIWTIFTVVTFLKLTNAKNGTEPLFLTPLINSGSTDTARNLCKVGNLPFQVEGGIIERESCSGFITVNETFNSNIFFWFFPALNDPEDAPVILWLDGGPGITGLFTFFTGYGPYHVNHEGKIEDRSTTWTGNHSMIIIDNPVGAGFSFTDNENGYSKISEEAAENSLEFLNQFFTLFPEYQQNPFYIAGISYGGHFAPPLASLIHHRNQEGKTDSKINLKSLLLYVPWTNPMHHVDYGDYLYSAGLIDSKNLTYFKAEEAKIKQLIQNQEYSEAKAVCVNLVTAPNSTFIKATGFSTAFNLLHEAPDPSGSGYNFAIYVENPAFRSAIHVGNITFNISSPLASKALDSDFMTSVSINVEEILNATAEEEEEYQVVVIATQMDLSVTHLGVEKMLNELNLNGSIEFNKAGRNIWKVGNKIAGYIKKVKNLNYVFMRNAGHLLIEDQPEWNLELINQLSFQ